MRLINLQLSSFSVLPRPQIFVTDSDSLSSSIVFWGSLADFWFTSILNLFNLLRDLLDFLLFEVKTISERKLSSFSRCQLWHSTELAFNSAVEREAGSGFETGDVSVVLSSGILPDGDVGKLFCLLADRGRLLTVLAFQTNCRFTSIVCEKFCHINLLDVSRCRGCVC